jgi:hypothetical protein
MRPACIAPTFLVLCIAHPLVDSSLASENERYSVETLDQALRHEASTTLEQAVEDAQRLLADTVENLVTIFIAQNRDEFDRLTRGALPDWGVGCAIPSSNAIVVLSPRPVEYDQPFAEIVRHEWAHIALRHAVGRGYLPRFIDEGFAMRFAGQWSTSYALTLAKADLMGTIMPLESIDRVNFFNTSQAQIAYAQSHEAVSYLISAYGEESFRILISRLRDGVGLDEAMMSSIGATMRGFEIEYGRHVNDHFSWLMVLEDMSIVWIILALLIVVGYLIVRRRGKSTVERWQEEEKLESTDFDYEEGDPWD